MIPRGVTLGTGRRIPVSQRGWFTTDPTTGERHYTACMFAGEAQLLERRGYRLPLGRAKPAPGQPDNFVHELQRAGDPTPGNGSTIRQGQVALRKLFGDELPDIKYGSLTDDELLAELRKGTASIRMSVDCGKLPRPLKRWVGYGYDGRHAIVLDAVRHVEGHDLVARTDPMYKPARAIRFEDVDYEQLKPALVRTAAGEVIVTLAYQGDMTATTPEPVPMPEPTPAPAETDAARAARLEAELDDEHELRLAQAERSQQLVADVEAAIDRYNAPMETGS